MRTQETDFGVTNSIAAWQRDIRDRRMPDGFAPVGGNAMIDMSLGVVIPY